MLKSCPPGASIAVVGGGIVNKVEYSMLMVISAGERKQERRNRLLAGKGEDMQF